MNNSDISKKKQLEYINRVESVTNNLLQKLEQKSIEDQESLEWVRHFINDTTKKIQEDLHADDEIQKLWQTLRQKMEVQGNQKNSARTTKRYVKKFLNDVQTKKILFKESSKIKLSKEEEEQLKLFSKLQ